MEKPEKIMPWELAMGKKDESISEIKAPVHPGWYSLFTRYTLVQDFKAGDNYYSTSQLLVLLNSIVDNENYTETDLFNFISESEITQFNPPESNLWFWLLRAKK